MYLLLILSELEQDRSGLSIVNGGSEAAIALAHESSSKTGYVLRKQLANVFTKSRPRDVFS